jgi:hypothetical protein
MRLEILKLSPTKGGFILILKKPDCGVSWVQIPPATPTKANYIKGLLKVLVFLLLEASKKIKYRPGKLSENGAKFPLQVFEIRATFRNSYSGHWRRSV